MSKKPLLALQEMLEALRVEQAVSFAEAADLWSALRAVTDVQTPPFTVSGNEFCALINLAVHRYGDRSAIVRAAAEIGRQA